MMETFQQQSFLGWCTVINIALLILWFILVTAFRTQTYKFHSRWFSTNPEDFSQSHYGAMAGFNLFIVVFNLSPYIALRLIT